MATFWELARLVYLAVLTVGQAPRLVVLTVGQAPRLVVLTEAQAPRLVSTQIILIGIYLNTDFNLFSN